MRQDLLARKLKQGLITEAEMSSLLAADLQAGKLNGEVKRWTRSSRRGSNKTSRCQCEATTDTCFSFDLVATFFSSSSSSSSRRQARKPELRGKSNTKRQSITTIFKRQLSQDCQQFCRELSEAHEAAEAHKDSQQLSHGISLQQNQPSKHKRRSSFIAWLAAKPE